MSSWRMKAGALVGGGHVAPDAVQTDLADDAALGQPRFHLPHGKARRFPRVQAVVGGEERLLQAEGLHGFGVFRVCAAQGGVHALRVARGDLGFVADMGVRVANGAVFRVFQGRQTTFNGIYALMHRWISPLSAPWS